MIVVRNSCLLLPRITCNAILRPLRCHSVKDQREDESDKLYKLIEVEVRGHDRAVLDSYEWFATTAAKHLDIKVAKVWEPPKHLLRKDFLRSAHVHKKHFVQYEFRTYFRIIQLVRLTGSTADTYLEYIQRNLPVGVAMKVNKHEIQMLPEHICQGR